MSKTLTNASLKQAEDSHGHEHVTDITKKSIVSNDRLLDTHGKTPGHFDVRDPYMNWLELILGEQTYSTQDRKKDRKKEIRKNER